MTDISVERSAPPPPGSDGETAAKAAAKARPSLAPGTPFRVGVDIGGTFTDVVLLGADGTLLAKKVSSTPHDYGEGVATGVRSLIDDHGLDPRDASDVVHATTVATNTVLEGRGALTGLVTTEGFRDVLEFRRVRFPELYNLNYRKPPPLVPRRHRLEVRERLAADGSVRIPLDEDSVVATAERMKAAGIESVAICLLHSYLNPAHEKRVEGILRDIMPAGTFICCSCDVLPEIREYERTSTTVVNAYLGPVMARYLSHLQSRLAGTGLDRPLYVMQSGGGQMSVGAAVSKPAYLVESGPAAGVVAATHIAKRAGLDRVITLDIGGTTAKTAIVENGEPAKTAEFEVGAGISLSSNLVKGAGYAIKLPFIDVSEIGSGGGSKVSFDSGGLMKVGPESAGSTPGPVCYGKGGTQVTFTDAALALGYLNPDHLIGGDLPLHAAASASAIEAQLCRRLDQPLMAAAYGVFTIAVANMVRAVKSVSTYRGRDPREFTLIAFGGNGPLVAAAIAEELGIGRILVPPRPGVLSAFGLLVAETTHESVRAMTGLLESLDCAAVEASFADMARTAKHDITAQGFAAKRVHVQRLADLRYAGQAFELTIPADDLGGGGLATLAARFHDEHQRTYGHKSEHQSVELVNLRALARVRPDRDPASGTERPDTRAGEAAERLAYFGAGSGPQPTATLTDRFAVGARGLAGPVIIEEYDSTIVVPPAWHCAIDALGNAVLRREDR